MTTDQATLSVTLSGHRGPDHRPDDETTVDERGAAESASAHRKLASARRTRWGQPSW